MSKRIIERWRARRLHKAELQLADARYELDKWGFGMRPSEHDRWEDWIAELELKIERLSTPSQETPPKETTK